MNKSNIKLTGIILGVIASLVAIVMLVVAVAPNGAYALEAKIEESKSNITVVEKARNDKVVNLVDTIKQYDGYEQETMNMITEARSNALAGNTEEAYQNIQVIAEAYPELKSQDNYKTLMTEISVSENTVSEHRKNYNRLVNEYTRYVKKFPKRFMLKLAGYDNKDYGFLEYDTPETLTNIWD